MKSKNIKSNDTGENTLETMSLAQGYNLWTINKFTKFLQGDILEVGCGIGNFTKYLSDYGNVWAIDISSNYIEQTKSVIKNKTRVGFGDIEKGVYFFGQKKFDSIICLNVLEHIKDDTEALNNLSNLLKEKGHLILIVPIHQFLFGEIDKAIGHFRRYDPRYLKKVLEEKGFKVKVYRKINFLGAIGWWFAGKFLKNKTVQAGKLKLFNLMAPIFLKTEDLIEPKIGTSVLAVIQKGD